MRHFIDIIEQTLAEISMSPSRDENIDEYTKYFRDQRHPAKEVATFRDAKLYEVDDGEDIHLGFFDYNDSNTLFAYLRVFKNMVNGYPCIARTYTEKAYRNHGWMRYILDWFVANHGPLLSDDTQSPEARQMWLAMMLRPGKLKIYWYNTLTGEKEKVKIHHHNNTLEPLPDPWLDDNENIRLLAEVRTFAAYQLREDYRKINYYGVGRDFYNP